MKTISTIIFVSVLFLFALSLQSCAHKTASHYNQHIGPNHTATTGSLPETTAELSASFKNITLTLNSGEAFKAQLYAHSQREYLLVSPTGQELQIDPANIVAIELNRKIRWGRGLSVGAASGATVGAIQGYRLGNDASGFFRFTAQEKAIVHGIVWGIGGAAVGTTIAMIRGKDSTYDISEKTTPDKHAFFARLAKE